MGGYNSTGPTFIAARYNVDGSLDTTFGTNGWVSVTFGGSHEVAASVAIQPDGKIVVAGYAISPNQDAAIARLNPNGSLDTSFDQSSINNAWLPTHWGISTDVPAPADFDGDGKTDFAVYRPSTGNWYILNSSNGSFTIVNFGISEDKPVPADYDGDARADIAVFRPSTGTWYLQRSNAGFGSVQWGVATDIPTENAFIP